MTDDYIKKSPNAGRIGTAVEHLVAASCILASNAELNVSTSMVDDEGVDLVFHRRGSPTTLAVQVKARLADTSTAQRGRFMAFVRTATFAPRPGLHMLFVLVDRPTATIQRAWFVPSDDFARLARPTKQGTLRFFASSKADTGDQWSEWATEFSALPARILDESERLSALA